MEKQTVCNLKMITKYSENDFNNGTTTGVNKGVVHGNTGEKNLNSLFDRSGNTTPVNQGSQDIIDGKKLNK